MALFEPAAVAYIRASRRRRRARERLRVAGLVLAGAVAGGFVIGAALPPFAMPCACMVLVAGLLCIRMPRRLP